MIGISDFFSLVLSAIQSIFSIQGRLWDEWGVFPFFMLVFIGFTFYRFVIQRMFGAAVDGASDSVRRDR